MPWPSPPIPEVACRGLTFSYPPRKDGDAAPPPALEDCVHACRWDRSVSSAPRLGENPRSRTCSRASSGATPGRVAISRVDVRRIRIGELRRGCAMVRGPSLFSTSIHDIAFARPDAARELVRPRRWPASTPDRAFTHVYDGRGRRGDHALSGQRQCVAIARAMLANPPAHPRRLSVGGRRRDRGRIVITNLRGFLAARTAVVVSHRIAAVRMRGLIWVPQPRARGQSAAPRRAARGRRRSAPWPSSSARTTDARANGIVSAHPDDDRIGPGIRPPRIPSAGARCARPHARLFRHAPRCWWRSRRRAISRVPWLAISRRRPTSTAAAAAGGCARERHARASARRLAASASTHERAQAAGAHANRGWRCSAASAQRSSRWWSRAAGDRLCPGLLGSSSAGNRVMADLREQCSRG